MTSEAVRSLISLIGLFAQLAGAVLLVTLFFVLFLHARRRRYFLLWGRAWLALGVALSALVVRYLLLPELPSDGEPAVRAAYFAYQWGKTACFGLLALGTAAYWTRVRVRRVARWGLAATGGYALLTTWLSEDLTRLLIWQCPVAILALAYCAARLLRLPPSRRSLGSRATGACFALMAAQWTLYLAAFTFWDRFGPARAGHPLVRVVQYNSYIDLLLQMLLGYGMVVLLMEDAKREVDDAHAELAVAHDRLRRVSLYDALTGCLNRRAFVEQVALEGARASFGAVVMVDLDNLKTVNDTLGHGAGDELLLATAEALRQATRPADRLFRWGGDEFLLLMPGARAEEVQPLLEERIARAAAEIRAGAPPLLLSLGSADYDDADGLQAAIRAADDAMYLQKAFRKQGYTTSALAAKA